jgi:hypothetical protein
MSLKLTANIKKPLLEGLLDDRLARLMYDPSSKIYYALTKRGRFYSGKMPVLSQVPFTARTLRDGGSKEIMFNEKCGEPNTVTATSIMIPLDGDSAYLEKFHTQKPIKIII